MSDRRPWNLVEDAMVDDEIERLAKLTPEELEAEMKALDIDDAKARAMVDKAIAGADAIEAAEAAKAVKKEEAPLARVVGIEQARARRNSRVLWLAIAAGTVATVGITQGQQIVAWISPPGPSTAPTSPLPVPTATHPTPAEKQLAATLREEAFAACLRGYRPECEEKLDQAKALDPAGEEEDTVKVWRADIQEARHPGSDYVKIPSPR